MSQVYFRVRLAGPANSKAKEGKLSPKFCLEHSFLYTYVVYCIPNRSQQLPFWERIAAFLSFLAVVSALITPATMLAEEVRTGKLGGLCSVSTSVSTPLTGQNSSGTGSGDALQTGSHCDLCGSLTLAPLPLLSTIAPVLCTGEQRAFLDHPIALSAAVPGLPPGRGPPSHP